MEKLRGADDPATLTAANSLALLLEAWFFLILTCFFNQGTVCHQVEKCHLSSECWCLIFAVVESPLIVNLYLVFWILGLTSKAVCETCYMFILLDAGCTELAEPRQQHRQQKNVQVYAFTCLEHELFQQKDRLKEGRVLAHFFSWSCPRPPMFTTNWIFFWSVLFVLSFT